MEDEVLDNLPPQSPDDPGEEIPLTYPVPANMHIGVSTTKGTPPSATDYDDEEVEREQFGQPD